MKDLVEGVVDQTGASKGEEAARQRADYGWKKIIEEYPGIRKTGGYDRESENYPESIKELRSRCLDTIEGVQGLEFLARKKPFARHREYKERVKDLKRSLLELNSYIYVTFFNDEDRNE